MVSRINCKGPKTVLVTGADGFTGRYMIEALNIKGYRVVRVGGVREKSNVDFITDLTDSKSIQKIVEQTRPNMVVHLAAMSYVGDDHTEDFYKVNLFGTIHLLEALNQMAHPPEKILIASSANVYGIPNCDVIDESVPPCPVNHYANSKLAMEYMVRTWFDRLPIIITRPFNYTGPGQDQRFLIPKIVGHFRRSEREIKLGNLNISRDFSDVRDIVRCYVALLESEAQSTIVNICSGIATPLNEIIEMVNAIAGYKIVVLTEPSLVRTSEIPQLKGSNAYLKKLIGVSPNSSLQKTLQEMYSIETKID